VVHLPLAAQNQEWGKAYNVGGNRGVRLDFSNARHLLIGSQRPGELDNAIAKVREKPIGRSGPLTSSPWR